MTVDLPLFHQISASARQTPWLRPCAALQGITVLVRRGKDSSRMIAAVYAGTGNPAHHGHHDRGGRS